MPVHSTTNTALKTRKFDNRPTSSVIGSDFRNFVTRLICFNAVIAYKPYTPVMCYVKYLLVGCSLVNFIRPEFCQQGIQMPLSSSIYQWTDTHDCSQYRGQVTCKGWQSLLIFPSTGLLIFKRSFWSIVIVVCFYNAGTEFAKKLWGETLLFAFRWRHHVHPIVVQPVCKIGQTGGTSWNRYLATPIVVV